MITTKFHFVNDFDPQKRQLPANDLFLVWMLPDFSILIQTVVSLGKYVT